MTTEQNLSFIPKYEFKCIDFNHDKKEEILDILNGLGQHGWYIIDIIRERHILMCRFVGTFSWQDEE